MLKRRFPSDFAEGVAVAYCRRDVSDDARSSDDDFAFKLLYFAEFTLQNVGRSVIQTSQGADQVSKKFVLRDLFFHGIDLFKNQFIFRFFVFHKFLL